MSVDDSKSFTVTLSGAPLSWWQKFMNWWNSLSTTYKAAIAGTSGLAVAGVVYEGTKKKEKK